MICSSAAIVSGGERASFSIEGRASLTRVETDDGSRTTVKKTPHPVLYQGPPLYLLAFRNHLEALTQPLAALAGGPILRFQSHKLGVFQRFGTQLEGGERFS